MSIHGCRPCHSARIWRVTCCNPPKARVLLRSPNPADIGAITFLPTSGNFTFELPAGYTTPVVVYGADAAVGASGNWGFSNLTEGVHYTRDGATVTILTAPQSRQIIRIGVSSNPD